MPFEMLAICERCTRTRVFSANTRTELAEEISRSGWAYIPPVLHAMERWDDQEEKEEWYCPSHALGLPNDITHHKRGKTRTMRVFVLRDVPEKKKLCTR